MEKNLSPHPKGARTWIKTRLGKENVALLRELRQFAVTTLNRKAKIQRLAASIDTENALLDLKRWSVAAREGAVSPTILHLVPPRCLDPAKSFMGSTKDITGRFELFDQYAIPALTVACVEDESNSWCRFLNQKRAERIANTNDLSKVRHIIIDIPGSAPLLARHFRKLLPKAKIIFRSHNAEFFHRLDRMASITDIRGKLRVFIVALMQPVRDLRMLGAVDTIWTISEVDRKKYWSPLATLLGKRKTVKTLPYYMAAAYLTDRTEDPLELRARKTVSQEVVCITSGRSKSGRVDENALNFFNFVRMLPIEIANRWRFKVTGEVNSDDKPENVDCLGYLPSPLKAVETSQFVFLVSDVGWGFKTKIMDAVVCDNFVLLSETMAQRLPIELKPFAIVIKNFSDFVETLKRSQNQQTPGLGIQINNSLRTKAREIFAADVSLNAPTGTH